MSDSNTEVNTTAVEIPDNLDDFNELLNPTPKAEEEVKEVPTPEESPEQAPAVEDADTDDDLDEPEPDKVPEKPKNKTQERIQELNAKYREQERRANETEARLNDAIAKLEAQGKTEPVKAEAFDGPNPSDEDKYPLGEFDPNYQADLTRHLVAKELQAYKDKQEEIEQAKATQLAEAQLQTEWSEKVTKAIERYPDLRDKSVILEETFRDVEKGYGQYLAEMIMRMDYGPDVLNYLADNVTEAKTIVKSGEAAATRSLYHLEARFALHEAEKKEQKLKVSKAPDPPPQATKGTAARMQIAADTDNLDDFERLLFKSPKS